MASILSGNSLTGKPDAGDPPVRFGGRGDVNRHPYLYRSARHRSSRMTPRFGPFCVTFAKHVHARPGERLLLANAACGMRLQRGLIKGRPEPGAPLRSAPGYDGAGPSDRTSKMTKL